MLTKNDILETMLLECNIVKHLHGKVPSGSLEYRPSPDQRTTLEVMRYVSFCGIGGALAVTQENFEGYKEWATQSERLSAAEIPAAVDRQAAALKDLFAKLSDAELAERIVTEPGGHRARLERALVDVPLRWMVGYRMQLFLYAKACGAQVTTPNCWLGIDPVKKA